MSHKREDEEITVEETKTWFAKGESLALQRLTDPEFLQHKDRCESQKPRGPNISSAS